MAYENPIILNNSGNDDYAFLARDFFSNPIALKYMRLILANESQLVQDIEIRSRNSTGKKYNRKISLSQHTNSLNKTNLILVIKFDEPVIMDGNTYFITKIPAFSRVLMMLYY